MPEFALLRDLLVLLGLGVVVVVAGTRARIPPIVGFLITGVLCGPYGFGFIRDTHQVEAIAELGVILLLFTIGIEFSVQQLVRMRSFLLSGGTLQVLLTVGGVTLAARLLGLELRVAVFLGMLVALSSTAIVIRLIAERGETDSPHGLATLGILIFQDLCIVPMVLLVPFLGDMPEGADARGPLAIVAAAVAFVAAAWVSARWIVPRALALVVNTRKREVFVLSILLLCLGAAWVSARAGLSPALGAFLAGLMLSESEYNHQALSEVLPLREVFNSLFFVSIGMLFDVRSVLAMPLVIIAALVAVLVFKTVVTTGVAWALGQPLRVAFLTGLAIAQIGEFSFVLSKTGVAAGLLDPQLYQLFLAVAVGSMAATPVLLAWGPRLAAGLESLVPHPIAAGRTGRALVAEAHEQLHDHVIIVGYGLNGRNLARVLGRVGIPFNVIEMNPGAVRSERQRGRSITYGDAGRQEVLDHAGVTTARIMVVAISDPGATRAAVALARRLNPQLHILVRSRYVQEIESLRAIGTDEVIPEEFETSIEIFARVLRRYLVARDEIEAQVRSIRHEGYEMLRSISDETVGAGTIARVLPSLALESLRVAQDSPLAGLALADCELRGRWFVTVAAIQRADGFTVDVNPTGSARLETGDVALLLGDPTRLLAVAPLFAPPRPPTPVASATVAAR